jgi:hypothetical protein
MSAANKPAPYRHLVGNSYQRLLGNIFFNTAYLEHYSTRPNSRRPVIRLAFTLAHTSLKRLRAYRLVWEYTDINLAFTMQKVSRRHSTSLYMTTAYPALLQCL